MLINIFVRARRAIWMIPRRRYASSLLSHTGPVPSFSLCSQAYAAVCLLCCVACFSLSLPPPPSTSLSHLPLSQPPCRVPHQAKQSSPPLLQPDLVFATTFLYHLPLFAFLLFFLFFNTHLSHFHITHTHTQSSHIHLLHSNERQKHGRIQTHNSSSVRIVFIHFASDQA